MVIGEHTTKNQWNLSWPSVVEFCYLQIQIHLILWTSVCCLNWRNYGIQMARMATRAIPSHLHILSSCSPTREQLCSSDGEWSHSISLTSFNVPSLCNTSQQWCNLSPSPLGLSPLVSAIPSPINAFLECTCCTWWVLHTFWMHM